jgi:hypothetical protein
MRLDRADWTEFRRVATAADDRLLRGSKQNVYAARRWTSENGARHDVRRETLPQIIVTAGDGAAFGEGAVTLRERVNVADFESRHFATQLVERLGWAVEDADQVERRREDAADRPEGRREDPADRPEGRREDPADRPEGRRGEPADHSERRRYGSPGRRAEARHRERVIARSPA